MHALKTVNLLNSIIPISRFNKGEASKIFNEVNKSGAKIVVKNNVPECVLLSPKEYESLLEELEDAQLLAEAETRETDPRNKKTYSMEDIMKENGITEEDIANCDDVELE